MLDKETNNWETVADDLNKETNQANSVEAVNNSLKMPTSTLRLYWPSPLLENGIILTYTSGMNDKTTMDALVKDYAKSAIGIILVIHASEGLTKTASFFFLGNV